jgi:hypothetical protein
MPARKRFFSAWMSLADQVVGLADEAAAARHFLSAAGKYGRATAYYLTAKRMQSRHYEPRKKAYRAMLKAMDRKIFAGSLNCERVEIPYGAAAAAIRRFAPSIPSSIWMTAR